MSFPFESEGSRSATGWRSGSPVDVAEEETPAPVAAGRHRTHNLGVSEEIIPRDEARATLAARKELGEDMEPALVDAFVERIEQRLAQANREREQALKRKREHQQEMVLGAMGISIPLLALAAIFTGLAGVIVVCSALVLIAVVTAR